MRPEHFFIKTQVSGLILSPPIWQPSNLSLSPTDSALKIPDYNGFGGSLSLSESPSGSESGSGSQSLSGSIAWREAIGHGHYGEFPLSRQPFYKPMQGSLLRVGIHPVFRAQVSFCFDPDSEPSFGTPPNPLYNQQNPCLENYIKGSLPNRSTPASTAGLHPHHP